MLYRKKELMGMDKRFLEKLYDCPIIAAVKDEAGLERSLTTQCGVIFFLFGTVLSIGALVDRVKDAGKLALIHVDLVEGLAMREVAVDYIAQHTRADGIITTKPQMAKRAKELGLISLERFFLLDSMALETMRRQLEHGACDLVEVLPGVMPKLIRRVAEFSRKPVIAGGLICDKEDVTNALAAGALAVSTTNENVWML